MDYKKTGYFSIAIIALGIVINTTLNESLSSLGVVFIAWGIIIDQRFS